MQLQLNIYRGGAVEKTYTADQFDIMFGTVEDIVALIDVDAFGDGVDNNIYISAVLKLLTGGMDQVKNLLKEVFPGVTDDELKRTKVKELTTLILNLVKFSFAQISSVGTGKN